MYCCFYLSIHCESPTNKYKIVSVLDNQVFWTTTNLFHIILHKNINRQVYKYVTADTSYFLQSYNLQTTLTFDTEIFRTWSWLCPISPSRRLSRTSRPSPRSQSPSWSWWLAPCCQSRSPSPLPSPRTDTRPHIQSSSHNSRVWILTKISFFEVFKYLWSVNNSYCTQYLLVPCEFWNNRQRLGVWDRGHHNQRRRHKSCHSWNRWKGLLMNRSYPKKSD